MAAKSESVIHLVDGEELTYQREQKSMTAADVIEFLNGQERKSYNEKDVSLALDRLFSGSDQFILKINFDAKKQMPVYVVNWQQIFKNFKFQLKCQIIDETLSKYHTRIIRILNQKGFLEEKDITQLCLLPLKDTRGLLNQLLNEGYVKSQEI